MAQRSHTTDAGSIACVDLGELGAGKEGWLVENPNLISALDTHSLALANCSIVLLLEWSNNASDALSSWVRIRPNLSPIEAEYISAIEWLVFDDVRVLALGTSCGYLLIYSLNGQLIHKQDYLLRLRVAHHRWDPTTYENEKLSSDVLISTPIFTGDGEGGSGFAAAAAGGVSGFDFDVDPNVDPELALALLVSMEEERARQEKAAKKAAEEASNQGKSGEQESTSQDVTMTGSAVPAASEPENKTADLMADLLLSFGHGNDLRALSAHIPRRCHCLLMSATISAEVEKLAAPLLHNPYILTLQEQGKDKDEIVSKNIQQYYIKCSARDKILYKIC